MLLDPDSATAYSKAASVFVGAFSKLVRTVGKHFPSAVLTALLLLGCYAGVVSIQEGSWNEALRILLTSRQERLEQDAHRKADHMQTELRAVAASNEIVKRTLVNVLVQNPGTVRARASLIHNGQVTLSQRTVLRWDVLAAVAVRGRSPGELDSNKPLIAWNSYLPDMLAGKCVFRRTETLDDAGALDRMRTLGILAFVACPIVGSSGQMLGGLFVSYDTESEIPTDRTSVMEATREAAIRVGAAWELRPLDLTLRD